jgi:hypothetical protein
LVAIWWPCFPEYFFLPFDFDGLRVFLNAMVFGMTECHATFGAPEFDTK